MSLRERKKRETKNALLDAALELFQAQGFDATSIEEIAERANVSRGTFFNYFATKETLLSEIAAVEMQTLERIVAVELKDWPSAVEKIRHVMRLLIADTIPFLRVTRHVLLGTMLHPSDVPSPIAQLEAIVGGLVQEAQTLGEIRADLDPTDVAHVITGTYLAAFFSWLVEGQAPPLASNADVDVFGAMLFEGIAGPKYGQSEED